MYNRDLTQEILNKIHTREIIFLLGTRQTGKTTLTKLISVASDFKKSNIFYFEFEKKYKSRYRNIRKVVVNQSFYQFDGDIEFIPAYLL